MRRGIARMLLAAVLLALPARGVLAGSSVTVGDLTFVNKGLVGFGRLAADLRDKFGETFGSGSGLALDVKSWAHTVEGYEGIFYMLPDRGYNIGRTTDYRPRLNKLGVTFKPLDDAHAPGAAEQQRSLAATLLDTILLTDATGEPLTALDPAEGGIRPAANGLPDMPQGANGRIAIDAEALVLLPDGSFFLSDEYGPYLYRFSSAGQLLGAIRPPQAFIPQRNGHDHFSSDNPGAGLSAPQPRSPQTGRQNNQGFEGLALTPDGKFLVAMLQSATVQDGGNAAETRQYTRMLYYDISEVDRPRLVREHVVPLPVYRDVNGRPRVAAQSELLALDENFFLLLCRDSGNGYGADGAASVYRKVQLLDTTNASNIAASMYDDLAPVAPNGVLVAAIAPAVLTPLIDLNEEAELRKAGLHNGEPNDSSNLSEKWEGMTLAPALDPAAPRDVFLFISNDNDFITQKGHQAGADYKDASGVEVDTMLLVYRMELPEPIMQHCSERCGGAR
ncbi:MAG: esterase-like activity of phytase family protein [Xanthobacteraceae bacterium]